MSSKTQSERSSNSASPIPKAPPRSLIVSKVSLAKDETWLFKDLNANYPDVKNVSRNHDQDGNELSSIRVDFDSEDIVLDILNENAIYIQNKPYYIRPYWPKVCYRCNNEGHVSAECPRYSLSEKRLTRLVQEQKSNFENLLHAFENRWNARLTQLNTPPKTSDFSELLPVVNDLNSVCQQLHRQNVQMQQQLSTITNRLQNIQTKVNN